MSENFAGPFDGKKPLRFVNLRPTRVNASEDRHIVYQDEIFQGKATVAYAFTKLL